MRSSTIFFFCLLAFSLAGSELPVDVKLEGPYNTQQFSFSRNIIFSNGHNRYTLVFVQNKATETSAPRTSMYLHGPTLYGSFSRPTDFARLTVNGIPFSRLEPRAEDIRLWKDGKNAGADISLNFDGARLILRFYMREDSPVLFGSVRRAENSVTPFQTAILQFHAVPSGLTYGKDRKIVWQGEDFAREAVTAKRTILADEKAVPLSPEDCYFILQDSRNNGVLKPEQKDNRENIGPCFLTCDLSKGVERSDLLIRRSSTVVFTFRLCPEQWEFRFGVWQHKNRHSNSEFRTLFEKTRSAFLLK